MMLIGPRLLEFARRCLEIDTEAELHLLLSDMTRRMGFERFALNHHIDLAAPPGDAIAMMNYPAGWVDRALARGYHLDDPVHAASARSVIGFSWGAIPRIIALTPRQHRILEEARPFGLCDGFTVPVHVPGEYRGTCSFGARHLDIDLAKAIYAQIVGLCAFECARRVSNLRIGVRSIPIPDLTQRHLDCLPLVAYGKTNWEIGTILGISRATAHQHVGEMMRRFGVTNRTQLIVRALFNGQIVYNAAMGW